MAISRKGIRGKRARARQRGRQGHDVRSRYRAGDLPAKANIGVLTLEDPYTQAGTVDRAGLLHIEATREPVRHADGTLSEGAPAWMPPTRPLLNVVANLRNDPFGPASMPDIRSAEPSTMPGGATSSLPNPPPSAALLTPISYDRMLTADCRPIRSHRCG